MMKYEIEEDEDGWDYGATLYQINKDGTKTEVGYFGSEPEDNTHYRAYSWVIGALEDAYKQGLKDGANKEYDRLRDKV